MPKTTKNAFLKRKFSLLRWLLFMLLVLTCINVSAEENKPMLRGRDSDPDIDLFTWITVENQEGFDNEEGVRDQMVFAGSLSRETIEPPGFLSKVETSILHAYLTLCPSYPRLLMGIYKSVNQLPSQIQLQCGFFVKVTAFGKKPPESLTYNKTIRSGLSYGIASTSKFFNCSQIVMASLGEVFGEAYQNDFLDRAKFEMISAYFAISLLGVGAVTIIFKIGSGAQQWLSGLFNQELGADRPGNRYH
ncbi:MAG: hypothetical protein A3E87_06415 [Gammaproteobacteria bacterium RIFCSPHIGHO2_12_FULL_35_23]|nr:MAG: hypothetical protein A3E87_06415 [Gammaproteobacteria bacterium RIFCSPHIGHO2_12_FULL_35_23]